MPKKIFAVVERDYRTTHYILFFSKREDAQAWIAREDQHVLPLDSHNGEFPYGKSPYSVHELAIFDTLEECIGG